MYTLHWMRNNGWSQRVFTGGSALEEGRAELKRMAAISATIAVFLYAPDGSTDGFVFCVA